MFEFCLPTSAKAVPDGPDWLHEIKCDGFRILVRREDDEGARGSPARLGFHDEPNRWIQASR